LAARGAFADNYATMPPFGDRPEPRVPPCLDRRKLRTDDSLIALARLLDAARRTGGLEALVLADDAGLAIAGAGLATECEQLAAMAPFLVGSEPANDTLPSRLDVMTRSTAVRRLRIDGIDVFLCAEGAGETTERSLSDAADGCERILRRRG
jgi:hypothetical protein